MAAAPTVPAGTRKATIEIVDITQIPVTTGERAGKMDYIVTVRLPNGRVYFVRIPAEELNLRDPETAKKVISSYIREQIGDMLRLIGTKLEIEL